MKAVAESIGLDLNFMASCPLPGCGNIFGTSIWSLVICIVLILLSSFISFISSRGDDRISRQSYNE